jgi:hypothetical protein
VTLTLLSHEDHATSIPPELDPRLASYAKTQVKLLRLLDGSQRASLVLEQYPELREMPLVDWERLSYWPAYSVLYGAASRHFARVQLAALQGILLWTGATPHYLRLTDTAIRHLLELLQSQFGIETPADLTFDLWERLARDAELIRTKHQRIEHLLLPAVPKLFHRHLTTSERAGKAKTDIVSRCATAILALTQARKASIDRFISWYREQIRRIETGELPTPAHLVYEDLELDLPRQPGPDAASLTDLAWQRKPVRLALTIWRPRAFVSTLHEGRVEATPRHSREREIALNNRRVWRSIQRTGKRTGRVYKDPSTYFAEAHPDAEMPWFMYPTAAWFKEMHDPERRTKSNYGAVQADGRLGANHAGLATPDRYMTQFFSRVSLHERAWGPVPGIWFEPEALYRGILYGSAIVMLMLTSDARIGEVMQVSEDRFVRPARLYVLKNPDGTPRRDP